MQRVDFLNEQAFLVLEALLHSKHYLRELAEKTKLAPSTVHDTLSNLSKHDMVLVENMKNRKVFSPNYQSPLTTKAISLLFVSKIIGTKSFSKLVQLKPKGIFLFGTAQSGKMTAMSDIDLAVSFEKKPDAIKVSQIKKELSNELNREIDLIILTPEKIGDLKKQKTELLNQIINQSAVLWGEPLEPD